jgi:hypothetical protein
VPQIPEAAAHRLGVFSQREARAAGWTPAALRHAVQRERLERLRPGVYGLPQAIPDNRFDAACQRLSVAGFAAALANPSATISHAAAATLHGLATWRQPETPCMTVLPHFVGDIEHAHLHRAQLPAGHVTTVGGVATATIARSVIDIGREDGALSALVTADAALHAKRVDLPTLRDRVRECAGWPGVRAARQAIELADGRSESPLESASRFKLSDRVPTPELQASIFDVDGRFLGRSDFLWEDFGVVGEADGMQKYDDDSARTSMRDEKLRHERFERAGLIVVRWGSDDLKTLDELVGRLKDAYARGRRADVTARRRWIAVLRPRAA